MSEPPHPATVFLPFGIFLAILAVTLLAPGLGAVMTLLTPTPLILLYLQHGKPAGLAAVGAVVVVLGLTLGLEAAVGFAAGYAVTVIFLAEGIRFGVPCGRTIGVAALATTLLSGFLVWMALSGKDTTPIRFFEEQLHTGAQEYLKTLEASGAKPDEVQFMRDLAGRYTPVMARTFPAILAVGSLLTAVLNFALVGALWRRFYVPVFFQNTDLTRWTLPDPAVWGFIAAAVVVFFAGGAFKLVGLNVFIVMVALYFFQGLSIALHILKSKGAHWLLTAIVLLLVFTQPMLMGLVIGLGLFDVWADFRKIRAPEPPGPDDTDDDDEF